MHLVVWYNQNVGNSTAVVWERHVKLDQTSFFLGLISCPTWVYLPLQIRTSFVYPLTPCLHMSRCLKASLMHTEQYGMPAWQRRSWSRYLLPYDFHLQLLSKSGYNALDRLKHILADKMTKWSLYELCLQPHPSVLPQCSIDRWSYARRQTADSSHPSNSPNTLVNVSDDGCKHCSVDDISNLNIHHNNTCNHVTTV